MNEHFFGPQHPGWTAEHQAASEPTERELLLIKQRDEARAEAMEERNHREKLEVIVREVTRQRDDARKQIDAANAALAKGVEEFKVFREALRQLWYLRVPTGMKLEEMLLELGHKELWLKIHSLVEPS